MADECKGSNGNFQYSSSEKSCACNKPSQVKTVDSTISMYKLRTNEVDLEGWTRVRHASSLGTTWHEASDQLHGTESYGDPQNDDISWSR